MNWMINIWSITYYYVTWFDWIELGSGTNVTVWMHVYMNWLIGQSVLRNKDELQLDTSRI